MGQIGESTNPAIHGRGAKAIQWTEDSLLNK